MKFRRSFRYKLVVIFLLGIFTSCTFELFAQKHNVLNYTTKDGLPSQIVNDIFQDKDGYFWFATQSGISQFNGHDFIDFKPSKQFEGIDAVSVVQDQQGKIYIGTNTTGLFVIEGDKTINYNDKNGLKTNTIRKVYLDKKNQIWVLTSAGVYQLVKNTLKPFIDTKNLFEKGVLSMTEDQNGNYYFGTQGKGLITYTNGKFSYFNEQHGITDNYIFSIKHHGDSLLLGTTSKGLIVGKSNRFHQLSIPEINNAWISNILFKDNQLYIISSSGLINYSKNGSYQLIGEKNGLKSNDLYNGFFDRENNLWLTSGNGISCIRKEQIFSLDAETGLSTDNTTCITKLTNGFIAIGTYGNGINLVNDEGNVIKHILIPELENTKITCIKEISDRNELWIGTEQSNFGIIVLDLKNNTYKLKQTIAKLNNTFIQTVTKIDQDKSKVIWVGTFNAGLFKIDKDKVQNFNQKNGLPSNEVYSLMIDQNNIPWLSIYQKGLFKLVGNHFERVFDEKYFNEKYILSLQCDAYNNIYIGTNTKGLIVLKDGKYINYTKKDGLLSNSIQGISIVNQQIWLGTNRGLNLIIPKTGGFNIVTFDERTGLKNTEIQQNAVVSLNQNIWIATSSGVSKISFNIDKINKIKPLIKIQNVKLFFNEQNWKKKKGVKVDKEGMPVSLELSYKENHLIFDFTALTNSSVFYSYLLEGQDTQWSPLSDKHEVTLANLNPGFYQFKVKSIDNYGNESDVLSIPIIINPPFYQTWWFRISVVIFGVILIVILIRLRERNYRERQLELENTVQERTSELVQKNKEVLDSITYAKRIQTAMLPSLDFLKQEFQKIFVFYRPKDIVAGDFYWVDKVGDKLLIAVADCTGHGVPGAMVSVICNNALNRATREFKITNPGKLLDKTRELILEELSKSNEEVNDGMDISIAVFEDGKKSLKWAGANNPLWILSKNDEVFQEWKGDKQPVGRHINNFPFKTNEIELKTGDLIYFFTDGLADQFGGEKGKKLKTVGLKEILYQLKDFTLEDQLTELQSTFDQWKLDYEQVDDICLIAIKV